MAAPSEVVLGAAMQQGGAVDVEGEEEKELAPSEVGQVSLVQRERAEWGAKEQEGEEEQLGEVRLVQSSGGGPHVEGCPRF